MEGELFSDPKVGNADGMGSRITVRCKDGALRTFELYTGLGHLSRSLPVAFFG